MKVFISLIQYSSWLAAFVALSTAQATEPVAKTPPEEISVCIACHGTRGMSQLVNAPHIAGQPEIYLTEQLKAYRSGKRPNEVMAVIAKPLTDAQIEIAAKWYSSVKIEVKE
jgi:cytochrome c553